MLGLYYPAVDDTYSTWKNHLESQKSLRQINDTLKRSRSEDKSQKLSIAREIAIEKKEYLETIGNMSEELTSSINQGVANICGTLDHGFDILSNDIQTLGRSLNFGLSLIHEQQIINNLLLENTAELLRVPDIQKDRIYHLEQGLKHLKNALIDNDLYEYALDNLSKAESIEKTDHVVLHHIGMIYLYSKKKLDPSKAEKYFRLAAKFSIVETDPNAKRLANVLTGSVISKLSTNVNDIDKMKYVTAESLLQASWACHLQGKLSEAVILADEAFNLAPEMYEACYHSCLFNAMEDKKEDAIKALQLLVDKRPHYLIVIATNPVLAIKDYIQEFLDELESTTLSKVLELIKSTKAKMLVNSQFLTDLKIIESKLTKSNYLEGLHFIAYLEQLLPIEIEKEVYTLNKTNLITLRENISRCNSNFEYLNSIHIVDNDIKNIDIQIIEDIEKSLLADTSNQWQISYDLETLAKKISWKINDNLKILKESYKTYTDIYEAIRERRNKTLDSLKYGGTFTSIVFVISIIISFVLGVKGCNNAAEIKNVPLMDPIWVFLRYLFFGPIVIVVVFSVITWLISLFYKKDSYEELNYESTLSHMRRTIKQCEWTLKKSANIKETMFHSNNYISLKVFYENQQNQKI